MHPQCYPCWIAERGMRLPSQVTNDVQRENCCFCGKLTEAGIYRIMSPGAARIPHCTDDVNVFKRML